MNSSAVVNSEEGFKFIIFIIEYSLPRGVTEIIEQPNFLSFKFFVLLKCAHPLNNIFLMRFVPTWYQLQISPISLLGTLPGF